jgi:thiamine transport system ATP-binding protein
MAALSLTGISLRYGDHLALEGIDLEVPSGQLLSVLGPSGSGKSSLLRVVAGLERPATGQVRVDGRDVTQLPTHERGVGLMFQDYALFPHRDVAGNVAFGLRMQGQEPAAIRARVAEVLDMVGLPGAGARSVSTLSGGEQQRVALARALAPRPTLLMLDEPLGSLDRSLRERLPQELRSIFEALAVTVLYVTHDQEEASSVADRIVLLRDGRIEADAEPELLWRAPPTAFAARFLGFRNVAAGRRRAGLVESPWGPLPVRAPGEDGPVTVVLRPSSLRLEWPADRTAVGGPPSGHRLEGTVEARRFRGDHVRVVVGVATHRGDSPPLELEVRDGPLPAVGERVTVAVDPSEVAVIPDRSAGGDGRDAPSRDRLMG